MLISSLPPSLPTPSRSRILCVVQGLPDPRSGASAVVFHYYLRRLAESGHSVRLVVLQNSGEANEAAVAAYAADMPGGRFEAVCCAHEGFYRPTRFRPVEVPGAKAAVKRAAEGFEADLLLCFDIVCAWMGETIEAPARAVWLGDLNFETMWLHAFYGRAEGEIGLAGMVSALSHCWHWRRLYRQVLRRFTHVVACAQSSVAVLARIGIKARFLPFPWPPDSGRPRLASPPSDKPTLVMFGAFAGLGSRSAFHMIARELHPRLVQHFGSGGFRFLLSGRGAVPSWVLELVAGKAEFEFLGFVDDLEELMDRSHAFLAPIDVPVGNRTRILTAMARGLPVIAHRSTALGNPLLVDGETCYLATNSDEFMERIARIFEDPVSAAALAARAKECRANHYGTDSAADQFIDFLMEPAS